MGILSVKHNLVIGAHSSELLVYDTTGVFDSTDNPGGWGNGVTTNPTPAQVTASTLSLYFSDGSQSLGNNILSAVVPFPNSIGIPIFLDSRTMVNPLAVFPDGLVDSEYRVDGEWPDPGTPDPLDAFFSLDRRKFFFYSNVECCVKNLFARVDTTKDPCSDENWSKFIYASRLLSGLKDLVACNKFNKATVVLTELQDFCTSEQLNCGC